MKVLIKVILALLPFVSTAWAQLSILPESKRYNQPQRIIVDRVSEVQSGNRRHTESRPVNLENINRQLELLEEIERLKKEKHEIAKIRNPRPHIVEIPISVRTLDEFKGFILNSSLVTNTPSEITIYSGIKTGPLRNAKFDCRGQMEGYRVKAYCTRAILQDRGIDVKILVRDGVDGAASIKPSKVWTGEEEEFLKMGFSTFAAALFDSAKSRSRTIVGDSENHNSKNRTLDGLFGVADQGRQRAEKGLNSIQTVGVINSGTEVVLQVLEGF